MESSAGSTPLHRWPGLAFLVPEVQQRTRWSSHSKTSSGRGQGAHSRQNCTASPCCCRKCSRGPGPRDERPHLTGGRGPILEQGQPTELVAQDGRLERQRRHHGRAAPLRAAFPVQIVSPDNLSAPRASSSAAALSGRAFAGTTPFPYGSSDPLCRCPLADLYVTEWHAISETPYSC